MKTLRRKDVSFIYKKSELDKNGLEFLINESKKVISGLCKIIEIHEVKLLVEEGRAVLKFDFSQEVLENVSLRNFQRKLSGGSEPKIHGDGGDLAVFGALQSV